MRTTPQHKVEEIHRRTHIYGALQKQRRELTNEALGQKFEVDTDLIRRIAKDATGGRNLTDEDRRLILDCVAERNRLDGLMAGHCLKALVSELGVSKGAVARYRNQIL